MYRIAEAAALVITISVTISIIVGALAALAAPLYFLVPF